MTPTVEVYVEVGSKRTFAGGLAWPGWCRAGRDEASALGALAAYGQRYTAAMGPAAAGFVAPSDASGLTVVERLPGDATTDFGAPSKAPAVDAEPVDEAAFERLVAILRASWAAVDRAAAAAVGVELRKGPRGGGRELEAIVRHVMDADGGYLRRIEGTFDAKALADPADVAAAADALHTAIVETLAARQRGEPPAKPRRSGAVWTTRYFVRRSAWHALDHAWEIEDRAVHR